MAFIARASTFGVLGAVILGTLGVTGAVLLATGGEGDEMMTRVFPLVLAATSLALIAVAFVWARSMTLRVGPAEVATALWLAAVVVILAVGW